MNDQLPPQGQPQVGITDLFDPIRFWDHRCEQTGWLSNFFPHALNYHGKPYPTSEHLYQALKWSRLEDRERVRLAGSPKFAKRESRMLAAVRGEPEIWRKATIMREVIRIKFAHPLLAQMLTSTRGVIIEASPVDPVWGIGDGSGLNLMGLLLMELRTELWSNTQVRRHEGGESAQSPD